MSDQPQFTIAGRAFADPALVGVQADIFRGVLRLSVAECATPSSWEKPEIVDIEFDNVIEIRALRVNTRFGQEEITDVGQKEAGIQIGDRNGDHVTIAGLNFRVDVGFTGSVAAKGTPSLYWVTSDGTHVEFVFAGQPRIIVH